MRRNFIKKGDRTTSGAIVTEGFDNDFHYGVPLTFVGAQLFCPACSPWGSLSESDRASRTIGWAKNRHLRTT